MPKIMYRPNPVPPPFVPPTPDYPENSISFSPTTFNIGQSVVATIHKVVSTPETTKIRLYLHNNTMGSQVFEEISVEPNYIDNVEVPFVSEFDFADFDDATVELWNGIDYEYVVNLILAP